MIRTASYNSCKRLFQRRISQQKAPDQAPSSQSSSYYVLAVASGLLIGGAGGGLVYYHKYVKEVKFLTPYVPLSRSQLPSPKEADSLLSGLDAGRMNPWSKRQADSALSFLSEIDAKLDDVNTTREDLLKLTEFILADFTDRLAESAENIARNAVFDEKARVVSEELYCACRETANKLSRSSRFLADNCGEGKFKARDALGKQIGQLEGSSDISNNMNLVLAVLQKQALLLNQGTHCQMTLEKLEALKDTPQESTSSSSSDGDLDATIAALREELASLSRGQEEHIAARVAEARTELASKVEEETINELTKIKVEHAQNLAASTAKLLAIEAAIDKRAHSERVAFHSHYLWLAVEALKRDINGYENPTGDLLKESELTPLHRSLSNVWRASESGNSSVEPLVSAVLGSFDPQSRERGVYTQGMLYSRWDRVRRAAGRVCRVNGGSPGLWAYVVSYMQYYGSFTGGGSRAVEELDTEASTNLSLLSLADRLVKQGDLAAAVRIVAQLSGESSNVASDWLSEARRALEAKQAVSALTVYATAVGFSARGCEGIPY